MNQSSVEVAGSFRSRIHWGTVALLPILMALLFIPVPGANAATAIGLGTAESYGVLAGAGVTNTGPSVINGDLGTAPTPAVTGFGGAPNGTVNGATHQGDAAAASAKDDLTTAYNNAAGQGPTTAVATELGGQTLTPGVYNSASGTFGITGALTLNAQGNPDSVFIFKTASTLISASASSVNLINGAQACNVFWKVGSSTTLGTGSKFVGNIFALASISVNDGVTVAGRLLARNGSVTLINDTINRARCASTGGGGGGGNGGGGGGGGGGNGGGNGGGGGLGGGGGNGGPNISIPKVPTTENPPNGPSCIHQGFRAKVRIKSNNRLASVKVYVAGKLIKQTTRRNFSVWVSAKGIRHGRNVIRVVARDVQGNRKSQTRGFRWCSRAVASPDFTG